MHGAVFIAEDKMEVTHLTEKDYTVSRWSGGRTVQLAIFPEDSLYADRSFLWRISSATVELDESDFTTLPDYMRYIGTVSGSMKLCHNGGECYIIHPGETAYFDGADATHSWWQCTDFNLMLRKGRCEGGMCDIAVSGNSDCSVELSDGETALYYCTSGTLRLDTGGKEICCAAGESLLLSGPGSAVITGSGSAKCARAKIL